MDLLPNRVTNPYIMHRKLNKRYASYDAFMKEYDKLLLGEKSKNMIRYL